MNGLRFNLYSCGSRRILLVSGKQSTYLDRMTLITRRMRPTALPEVRQWFTSNNSLSSSIMKAYLHLLRRNTSYLWNPTPAIKSPLPNFFFFCYDLTRGWTYWLPITGTARRPPLELNSLIPLTTTSSESRYPWHYCHKFSAMGESMKLDQTNLVKITSNKVSALYLLLIHHFSSHENLSRY